MLSKEEQEATTVLIQRSPVFLGLANALDDVDEMKLFLT